MNQKKLPENWSDEKLQRVLAHYEQQGEEDALGEDEASLQPPDTVMTVPHDLVPEVRELIAKHRR
jgi:hypothetical protein